MVRFSRPTTRFLHMLGYDQHDIAAGNVHWTELTAPEWHERDAWAIHEIQTSGTVQPYEKEYFHKDGRRVPVLIGATAFDEKRDQGVAFVLDLTERKRAEAEAHDSERRYREVQAELAHASRVSTMGLLTASIAHEVKQPITASVINAQAALRWLDRKTPDLEEARQALAEIVNDGMRAGEVIDRIRALVKRGPQRKDGLEINGAIREVIELTRSETVKNGVSVQMQLAEELPLVAGDRVQLQQVILNLVINAVQAMSETSDGPRQLSISTGKAESGGILVAVQIPAPDWHRRRLSISSRRSTRPSRTVWGWGSLFAARLLKRMADGYGRAPISPVGPSFNSQYQLNRTAPRNRGQSLFLPGSAGGPAEAANIAKNRMSKTGDSPANDKLPPRRGANCSIYVLYGQIRMAAGAFAPKITKRQIFHHVWGAWRLPSLGTMK